MFDTDQKPKHYHLVKECQAGNERAHYQLYQLYSRAMLGTCLRMLSNRETAEDVLQEAFTSAFKNIHRFRQDSSFGSWLKQIVINHCINHLNKKGLLLNPLDEQQGDWTDDSQIDENNIDWTVEGIKKSLEKLSNGYRTVLNLYLLEGYDHTEIASILGISESTSKTQYMRAKKKLKEQYVKSYHE